MSQPKWKMVANLGDVNPIEHGGYFVFVDETGVYPPEAELLELNEGDSQIWTVHRFILEPCTFENGILSDNKFHPESAAWFAAPESKRVDRPQDTTYLSNICECMDILKEDLIELFLSDDPLKRAQAWRMVGDYHGFANLDDYPLSLARHEVFGRYQSRLAQLEREEADG